eukprot:gene32156-16688_t
MLAVLRPSLFACAILLLVLPYCPAVLGVDEDSAPPNRKDPRTCTPPLFHEAKQFVGDRFHCKELRNTCIAQGGFIVFDKEHVAKNPFAEKVPQFDFTELKYFHRHHNPWITRENETVHGNTLYYTVTAERVVVRLPTKKEWSRNHYFSNCTMPIIFYENWQHNPTEFFQRSPALLALNQQAQEWDDNATIANGWDDNATIVMAMPAGIEALQRTRTRLQAFSKAIDPFPQIRPMAFLQVSSSPCTEPAGQRMGRQRNHSDGDAGGVRTAAIYTDVVASLLKVTTLTEFSEERRRHSRSPSQSTWEGYPVKCFARIVICTLINGAYSGMYVAGQMIYEHYKPQLPPANPEGEGTFFREGPTKLKVLFEKRPGSLMRQILNMQDILTESKTYPWGLGSDSGYDGVEMREHTFGNNLLDIAIMREVDVFITPHSAGSMHAHFMRQHSSFLEIRAYEFGTKYPFMARMVWPSVCEAIQ